MGIRYKKNGEIVILFLLCITKSKSLLTHVCSSSAMFLQHSTNPSYQHKQKVHMKYLYLIPDIAPCRRNRHEKATLFSFQNFLEVVVSFSDISRKRITKKPFCHIGSEGGRERRLAVAIKFRRVNTGVNLLINGVRQHYTKCQILDFDIFQQLYTRF